MRTDHTITLTSQELSAPFKATAPDTEPLKGPTRVMAIAEGDPPKYTYVRYVRHREVEAFKAKGWVVSDDLSGTHHGRHAQLLEWRGEGEPE